MTCHGLGPFLYSYTQFVIYIHYFAPFPHVPITILLNVLITKAWPWRVVGLYQHCMISTWIGELLDLNLAEEWPFRSACWHFDNVLLLGLGTFSEQNYPQLTHTFQLSFENILHKITQCLVKLLSICASDDDWGHSLKMIVNYEDGYLKHHVNKTMLFLSSERFKA